MPQVPRLQPLTCLLGHPPNPLFLLVLAPLLLLECNNEPQASKGKVQPAASTTASTFRKTVPNTEDETTEATGNLHSSPETNEPGEHLDEPARKRPGSFTLGNTDIVIDELVDVAPAGPSVATSAGVLMLLRDRSLRFAPIDTRTSRSKRPQNTPIRPLELDPSELVALAHGPVVAGGHVYFVEGSRLLRRKLPNGSIEELATDARAYTRVVVPDVPHKDRPLVVGYIARHPTEKDTLLAKLWIEGQPSVTLTPDGSAGNSVTLAQTADGYIAVSLESRTGMSPLHARRVSFEKGKVKLGPDVVPWIAGSVQPLTQVSGIGDIDSVFTFIPVERDASRFGLARIEVGAFPKFGSPVHWREYPNGLSPAVVTGGHLCGKPVVFYARPATAEPHATQELHLALVGETGLSASTVAATSRAFADASFARLDDGALVVYVADRRTWARRLRCVPH